MMNRYVDILNRIRQNANPNWLTLSQQVAYNLLRERLNFLDEVNLWGGHGVGKTFIGWLLHKQGAAVYVPCLKDVGQAPSLKSVIIVDNLGWRRVEVREALHRCRSQNYEKVVLITTKPVQEQMAVVELSLTDEDLAKVGANLRSIGVPPYSDAPHTLWDLVSPVELTCEGGM
ncbi:MAG: hypothetical protein ACUVXI_12115 [bacterium]